MKLVALAAVAAFAAAWSPLACPKPDTPFPSKCSSSAFATDTALTLFFQIESQGSKGGWFSCRSTASVTLCARNWTQAESGSVGSCFFLLVSESVIGTYVFRRLALTPLAARW